MFQGLILVIIHLHNQIQWYLPENGFQAPNEIILTDCVFDVKMDYLNPVVLSGFTNRGSSLDSSKCRIGGT